MLRTRTYVPIIGTSAEEKIDKWLKQNGPERRRKITKHKLLLVLFWAVDIIQTRRRGGGGIWVQWIFREQLEKNIGRNERLSLPI